MAPLKAIKKLKDKKYMKTKILYDVKIECSPPEKFFYFRKPELEDYAQYYEEWVKEFNDFIRDHRSQDKVSLSVVREYKEICEFCKYSWETDDNERPICCNKAIDEFDSEAIKKLKDK